MINIDLDRKTWLKKYLIELLVFNRNAWNHLIECKQMINIDLDRKTW